MSLDVFFRIIAKAQVKHTKKIVALTLFITLIQIIGATQIYLETDFSQFQPQDFPAVVLDKKVRDTFSGQDSIFLLVELDSDVVSDNAIRDIRDPRVVKMLIELGDEIGQEPSVDQIMSMGTIMQFLKIPINEQGITAAIKQYPQAKSLFNKDYSATIVNINSNIGTGKEKTASLMEAIQEDIENTPTPPGIKITMTGMPPLRVLVADILISDAVKTILISSGIILLVLILIQRNLNKGYLVFNPLIFALLWTIGTMGWLGINLSIITAGLGAMILGLGVEYSVFLVTKYELERKKGNSQEESIYIALHEVGTAIIGSSTTTMIGFLALLLSIYPMLHDLGTTLALGILFCVISSLLINPAFIIFEENILNQVINRLVCERNGVKK